MLKFGFGYKIVASFKEADEIFQSSKVDYRHSNTCDFNYHLRTTSFTYPDTIEGFKPAPRNMYLYSGVFSRKLLFQKISELSSEFEAKHFDGNSDKVSDNILEAIAFLSLLAKYVKPGYYLVLTDN